MNDQNSRGRTIETGALWEQLVSLEDGSLHPVEREDLMSLLEESEAARRLYAEYFMHSEGLAAEARFLDEQGRLPILSDASRSSRLFVRSLFVAAAVLVLGAIVASLVMLKKPQPDLLAAASTAGAKWTVDGMVQDPDSDDLTVAAGAEVQVNSGMLKLHLESGGTMILQGPARASFPELEKPILDYGWLWIDSGSSGRSFEVRTPGLIVRDIGTRFGVRVPEEGAAEIHLIDGKIEVFERATEKIITAIEPGEQGLLVPDLGGPVGIPLARDPFPSLAKLLAKSGNYATTVRSQSPTAYWRFNDSETKSLANEIPGGVTGGRHDQTKINTSGLNPSSGFQGFDEDNRAAVLSGEVGRAAVSLGITPIHQGVLFSENFEGNGASLNDTLPDESMMNTKWITSSFFKNDGTIRQGPGSATLGFTPLDGCRYTLDASLTRIRSKDDSWVALGFANGQSTGENAANRFVNESPEGRVWMLARGDNSVDPNMAHTRGTGDAVKWTGSLATANGGNFHLRIILDTTGGAGNWTASWYAKRPEQEDYTCVRASSPLISEMIGSVGLAVAGGDVSGQINQFSLRAEGISDQIVRDHLASGPARVAKREGAVSFWVRPGGNGSQREILWAAGNDPSDDSMHATLEADGRVSFFMENGRYDVLLTSQDSIVDGRWHHLALSWSPSSVDLFIDGNHVARDSDGRSMQQGVLCEFRLGYGPKGSQIRPFNGWIDEVALWERRLKAAEIHHQFHSAKGE